MSENQVSLGDVIRVYYVNASMELWIGGIFTIPGLMVILGILIDGALHGFGGAAAKPDFCTFLLLSCSLLGGIIFISALRNRKNRLVVYEGGLLQKYGRRIEVYSWADIAELEVRETRHYSSGLSYMVDTKAWLVLKSGEKRRLEAMDINREMLDLLHAMIRETQRGHSS